MKQKSRRWGFEIGRISGRDSLAGEFDSDDDVFRVVSCRREHVDQRMLRQIFGACCCCTGGWVGTRLQSWLWGVGMSAQVLAGHDMRTANCIWPERFSA